MSGWNFQKETSVKTLFQKWLLGDSDYHNIRNGSVWKKTLSPLFCIMFNCIKATEPRGGDSLFFTTNSSGVLSTYLIDLQRWINGQVSLEATSTNNIFLTILHNNLNMCFVHTLHMELKYTIYYSSPDAFSFIVSPFSTCRVWGSVPDY